MNENDSNYKWYLSADKGAAAMQSKRQILSNLFLNTQYAMLSIFFFHNLIHLLPLYTTHWHTHNPKCTNEKLRRRRKKKTFTKINFPNENLFLFLCLCCPFGIFQNNFCMLEMKEEEKKSMYINACVNKICLLSGRNNNNKSHSIKIYDHKNIRLFFFIKLNYIQVNLANKKGN